MSTDPNFFQTRFQAELETISTPSVEVPSFSGPTDDVLKGNAVATASRNALPRITSAIQASNNRLDAMSSIIHGLGQVFGYMESEAFAKAIFDRVQKDFLESDVLRAKIGEIVESKLAERDDEEEVRPQKAPKQTDKVLTEMIHFKFSELVHCKYTDAGTNHRVKADDSKWPDPVDGVEKVLVRISKDSPNTKEAWRPKWNSPQDPISLNFIEQVVSEVKILLADCKVDIIRGAAIGYFDWVKQSYANQGRGAAKAKQAAELKNLRQRAQQVHQSLQTAFEKSILNKCRERDLFWEAISQNSWLVRFFARHESHDLKLGDADGGVDEWMLFRDLWHGHQYTGVEPWLVEDCFWWSDLLRKGVWALFESARRKNASGITLTPIFHAPRGKWGSETPEDCPEIRSSSRHGLVHKPDAGKTMWICRAMVSEAVLADTDFEPFYRDLYPDPAVKPESLAFPTLDELLSNNLRSSDIRVSVEGHLRPIADQSDQDLLDLWKQRNEVGLDEYVNMLRLKR